VVRRLGAGSACAPFEPVTDRLLSIVIPADGEQTAEPATGIAWFAAGVGGDIASYMNARWGAEADNWGRARFCVQSALSQAVHAERFIDEIQSGSRLASIGLETTSSGDLRLKIYWRQTVPTLLASFATPLLRHPALCRFLATAISGRRMALSGLVFSAGFLISTGEMEDVKVDVCTHCLPDSFAGWLRVAGEVTKQCSLPDFSTCARFRTGRLEPAFLGLAVDRRDRVRANLYLKTAYAGSN
jgi:hypothetical protein